MIANKLTYISLFSSAGVGCFGFKQVGFECIATNEIIQRRLNIQRINKKCKYESGYIDGDIKLTSTKNKIYGEIDRWKKLGNDRVDVVISTPPCQGMSVANHKKNIHDLDRNSLIYESVYIIKEIRPRIFIFENVSSFWKTGCVDRNGDVIPIGQLIMSELGSDYTIHNEVINFKNYGSNSSRTRTLVIGIENSLRDEMTPVELLPSYKEAKSLFEQIGNMKSLEWGEYSTDDFYHSFRTYPTHMRGWIKELGQGMSAFENKEDIKKPHKVVKGKIVINMSKNADKYTRQVYEKVAPCIHTRNDQMASQNTIHPIDDRVFSIRELMKLMTIPDTFRWVDKSLDELNKLSTKDKRLLSKKEEMNIRQSIGEAVPFAIFQQIASKISSLLITDSLTRKEIIEIIKRKGLICPIKLKDFVWANKGKYSRTTLSLIVELANSERQQNSAYYTNKHIIQEIYKTLPDIKKDLITIVEPSVGVGNFLPFIFIKYAHIPRVNLIVVDIDKYAIEVLKLLYNNHNIPKNFKITYKCQDFMDFKHKDVDLIIGNPPFTKLKANERKKYLEKNYNKEATNLAEFILEKAVIMSDFVSLIMPKNLLNTPEYADTRGFLTRHNVESIIDFGENGFKGVLVETISININNKKRSLYTIVKSIPKNITIKQRSNYIFDEALPYWVIYRNDFFDMVMKEMELGVFDVFRDRQITNSNSTLKKHCVSDVSVIKSRNISDSGKEIIRLPGYDAFIDKATLNNLTVNRFLDNNDVYMTPNMSYKPRIMKKEKGYVVNGSVAILIPKTEVNMTEEQMGYIASDEFRKFYKIARNYQTRSLNVDKMSSYWFGIKKGV